MCSGRSEVIHFAAAKVIHRSASVVTIYGTYLSIVALLNVQPLQTRRKGNPACAFERRFIVSYWLSAGSP